MTDSNNDPRRAPSDGPANLLAAGETNAHRATTQGRTVERQTADGEAADDPVTASPAPHPVFDNTEDDELDTDLLLPSTPTTPLGLVGLSDLAPHLILAGFDVVADPDLKVTAQHLQAAVRIWEEEAGEEERIPVLLLNSPQVAGLIPRIRQRVDLTVLGTSTSPVGEAKGYRSYQLPGTVRDILKNAGVDGFEAVDDRLELQADGRMLDPDRDWDDWEPDPNAAPATDRTVEVTHPAGPADLADVVFSVGRSRSRTAGRSDRTGLGQVVLVVSGSGGVGKSTFALALAARASERGRRTVLVDANLGQGDLAAYLRVSGPDLPSMFDAVLAGRRLEAGIVTPTQLAAKRAPGLRTPAFALLQAPTAEQLRTGLVTPAAAYGLVEDARRIADLVVVDTQIVETDDPRRTMTDLIMPQLGRGGWAVAIAGPSTAGLTNLTRLLTVLADEGINSSRVLSMLSRMPAGADVDHDRLIQTLRRHSVHLGTAWVDDGLQTALNRGDTLADQPAVANLADTLLNKIFDLSVLTPAYDPEQTDQPKRSLRQRWAERKRSS